MKKDFKKILIIALFWTAIMVMSWFGDERDISLIERLICTICFSVCSILISFSFSKVLFKNTLTQRKVIPFILKFILMTICFSVAYGLLDWLLQTLASKGIMSSEFIENKDWWRSLGDDMPGLVSINLLFCGILLYYEYLQLQNRNLNYQLQILHSQINPHFMFNVLNHIYILMEKDTNMASSLLLKYSDTLRYQLYSGKSNFVKLDQEVQFLKNYIDVEKFRWEGKLDVDCSWNIENGNVELPPLLLITFIENAFKHVSRSQSKRGFINIKLNQKGQTICMEVTNSKSKNTDKKIKSSGIGLINVKTRLDILYAKRYRLLIDDSEDIYSTKLIINP